MVVFVLNDASGKAVVLFVVFYKVFVHVANLDPAGPVDRFVESRKTQASLGERCLVVGPFVDSGIDKGFAEADQPRILVGIDRGIDDKDPDVAAHLWGGKAYSVGFVHGFPQVGDESAQIGIIGSYILRFIPEHGRSVNVDW